jgi:hypothetical protein
MSTATVIACQDPATVAQTVAHPEPMEAEPA